MGLEKSNLGDRKVVKNMKKQYNYKSSNKKTTIEVHFVLCGALIVVIAWLCANWSIWMLLPLCSYITCGLMCYFHCLLIIMPHVKKN